MSGLESPERRATAVDEPDDCAWTMLDMPKGCPSTQDIIDEIEDDLEH